MVKNWSRWSNNYTRLGQKMVATGDAEEYLSSIGGKEFIAVRKTEYPKELSCHFFLSSAVSVCMIRGGSRIFSRGGGADFRKIFQNFDELFFFLGRPN